jgi:hypothetical protein
MLSYYEEVQTHPLNLFKYSLIKYLLHCQCIKNISELAQWLHRVWGPGGWWRLLTKQADGQLNFEWCRQKLLAGNWKKIAKFLMRTFTCRSTFLYACPPPTDASILPLLTQTHTLTYECIRRAIEFSSSLFVLMFICACNSVFWHSLAQTILSNPLVLWPISKSPIRSFHQVRCWAANRLS